MAEARRLGGLRRRREHAVAGAYELEGLDDVTQLRRVLTIATLDLLGLDTSAAWRPSVSRTLTPSLSASRRSAT